MAELSEDLTDRIDALEDGEGTEDIVDLIEDLPAETDRRWELALTRIIESAQDRKEDIKKIVDDGSSEDIRFAAFFAYCTILRRRGNVSEFKRALDGYDEFSDRPMYPHLQSLHERQLRSTEGYQQSFEHAREARSLVPGHVGVDHNYVTSIVEAFENDRGDIFDQSRDELLEDAEEIMEEVISKSDYPKFKVTLGRIRALQGNYDEAIRRINEGIDLEDDSKDDYALRVNEHRTHEIRVYLDKYIDEIEQNQSDLQESVNKAIEDIEKIRDESEERIRELQGQTLQFLGFFATLLAVIISTVTISVQFTVLPAASLILVLVGGLLLAFAGFTIILPIDKALRKSGALVVIGLVTTGIGLGVVAFTAGII